MPTSFPDITIENFPHDLTDPRWGPIPWPSWVKGFREHQVPAIVEAVQAYREGANLVLIDAPTGSGKTLIGEAIRRLSGADQAVYVAHTNGLIDQFMRDFGDYAKPLKGRSNYPTMDYPERFRARFDPLSCAECNRHKVEVENDDGTTREVAKCDWCSNPQFGCPYQQAKGVALGSPLIVTNTAYLLSEANGPGGLHNTPFIIMDECDTLESILLSHAEVDITDRRRRELDIELPARKTVEATWQPWVQTEAIPKVEAAIAAIKAKSKGGHIRDPKKIRELNGLVSLHNQLVKLEKLLDEGNAIYDYPDKQDTGRITFKPVRVNYDAKDLVWQHAPLWLCMSATIVSPQQYIEEVGIDLAELRVATVTVESTFPARNRPIRVIPTANMVFKEKETAWPKMVTGIKRVLIRHTRDRVLIHSVSYAFTDYLVDALKPTGRPIITYQKANEREAALTLYRKLEGAILIAPSMDRGVDLPGDACRVQIICKLPFMSTVDKRVARRLYGSASGQMWYQVNTIRTLIQMTGRGVRSKDDTCTCLDPDTRVLTEDLRWVPVGELAVGDKILGYDETSTRLAPRKWRQAEVLATGVEILPRMRITLANGEELIATPNHKWLSKWGQARDDSWVRTDMLKPGHHLNRYVSPWNEVNTRDAGWLAGFYDGEGCLSLNQGSRNRFVTSIVGVQKPGPVFDEALRISKEMGFTVAVTPQRPSGVDVMTIQGGFAEHLRFLGQVRPIRLLNKLIAGGWGQRHLSTEYVEVVSVECLEDGPMVTLQSSTETYIAEGYAAHNTYILDSQFVDNIWAKKSSRSLLPKWWKDALDWSACRR